MAHLTDRQIDTLKTAAGLIECNCSYNSGDEPRCDGSCTHAELLAIVQHAEAWALGWAEAINDNGMVSDVGRTNEHDQDWNEAYDSGRDARIKTDVYICDECGHVIPDAAEGGVENRHHADSCSLYDSDKD
jgi:hypothetical protein